jgi:HD-GYP domain-containing protein (c-di-GMP phosphodiesterase class II)
MAGTIALSQALSYARDLKVAYAAALAREQELADANARLRKGYQQSLHYAVDLKKTYRQLQRAIFQSLLGLARALEAKDAYTSGHSGRVAEMSRRLALAVGLSRGAAETIAQAGLLHDLGKIAVPERILNKPGPLSDEEWATMRRHPITSAQIVAPLEFFDQGAVILRHHHERHDGSGYPDGLRGDCIPLGARIVAVADVYDALTSDRAYRPRLGHAQAIRHLAEQSGRGLDEHLVAVFVQAFGNAPPAFSDAAPAGEHRDPADDGV